MTAVAADLAAPAPLRPAFPALPPAIRVHARAALRSLRSGHDWEDAEDDVVARTWDRSTVATATPPARADTVSAAGVTPFPLLATRLSRPGVGRGVFVPVTVTEASRP